MTNEEGGEKRRKVGVLLLIVVVFAAGCGREERAGRPQPEPPPPPPIARPVEPPPPPVPPYTAVPITGMESIIALQSKLGLAGFGVVLKLNRLDLAHVREGEDLIVPQTVGELMEHSPFPAAIESAAPVPKLILVSRRIQAVAAYEGGRQVWWAPASTGKKETPTAAGLFHTNWKAKQRVSTVDERWLLRWYFNIANFDGVSFHQYDLPGYPASHSCIRLLEEDARWIYDWAEQWKLSEDGGRIVAYGTPVVIFGEYDFEQAPPWRRLLEDPAAATVSPQDAESALQPHLPTIQERTAARAVFKVPTSSIQGP